MQAAILRKINEPLEVKEIELRDTTLKYGQVLVSVSCTGICGAQLQEIDGLKGNPEHCPHLLGHEGCGTVHMVGPGMRLVKPGDKVVMHWRKGTGCEAMPATYLCDEHVSAGFRCSVIKSGPIATFAKAVIVNENRVTRIPSDVPDDLAALLGCALSTALATIENIARVQFGESVLVVGCGGVGLSMILAARLARAHPIVGIDISMSKMKWTHDLGATFFANFDIASKYDVVIDTTGAPPRMGLLAPSGRYILVGQPKHSMWALESKDFFNGEGQTIQATQGGAFNPTLDIPRYVKLWRSGALDDYKNLISHRLCLKDINSGIALMREGKTARVMIYP